MKREKEMTTTVNDAMYVRDTDSYHHNSMTKAMEQNHLYF
jgi:hypothetical protein